TEASRGRSALPAPHAARATPWVRTRCRSWCRATGWSRAEGRSAATPEGSSARSSCSRWSEAGSGFSEHLEYVGSLVPDLAVREAQGRRSGSNCVGVVAFAIDGLLRRRAVEGAAVRLDH